MFNKIASRCGTPQASFDRHRHWNCFQTGPAHCKDFRKSKHCLLRAEVSWCDQQVDLYIFTCVDLYVLVSRSINMLSVTDFVPKGIISGVRVQAGLYLDMLDADRLPNAVSVHAGTSQADFEVDCPPHAYAACPPGDLLITMVKEMVTLYKKGFWKMKKVVSLVGLNEMKTRNDCEIACDCVKRANVVLHEGLC